MASDDDKAKGMKSAYELALERLERQGVERPDAEGLPPEVREKIAEARRKAEARVAELEILYRDHERKATDPAARQQEEEDYVRERRRIEEERDRSIAKLRRGE